MNTDESRPKRDLVPRTFSFAVRVVKFCKQLSRTAGADRTLANQLLRSGTSIAANVEEAQAAESRSDFTHKNAISLKEARESRYWLRLIRAAELNTSDELARLETEADELCRILGAIVAKCRERRKPS